MVPAAAGYTLTGPLLPPPRIRPADNICRLNFLKMSRFTAVRWITHDLRERRAPLVSSLQLFSRPILFYLPLCVLLFKQDPFYQVWSGICAHTTHCIVNEHYWVHLPVCVLLSTFCALSTMSPSTSQVGGGTLCVYWQITVGSGTTCLADTLSRQKIACSSAPSAVGMQTQQLWLLLTVTTRTGCRRRLSEGLLLHLHRKAEEWAKWKNKLIVSLPISLQTLSDVDA